MKFFTLVASSMIALSSVANSQTSIHLLSVPNDGIRRPMTETLVSLDGGVAFSAKVADLGSSSESALPDADFSSPANSLFVRGTGRDVFVRTDGQLKPCGRVSGPWGWQAGGFVGPFCALKIERTPTSFEYVLIIK